MKGKEKDLIQCIITAAPEALRIPLCEQVRKKQTERERERERQ